jgi:hypothetical protein
MGGAATKNDNTLHLLTDFGPNSPEEVKEILRHHKEINADIVYSAEFLKFKEEIPAYNESKTKDMDSL